MDWKAEKLKKDNGDKISDDDKKILDEAIEAGKKVVGDKEANKDTLETAAKELNDKMMPIGAKMYEQAGASEDAADTDDKDKKAADPIEGEVVDEKPEETEDKQDKKA